MTRARKLDSQALVAIHDEYFPVVYRYVRYRIEDVQVVEDITAEVFVRLLQNLHNRTSHIHDIRGWLLGTAANLINDYLRQKYRRPVENLEEHEDIPQVITPENQSEQSALRGEVQQALFQLTPDQQHVLSLRFGQEMSIEETARAMQKSISAIKVLQFRALAAVRRILGKKGFE